MTSEELIKICREWSGGKHQCALQRIPGARSFDSRLSDVAVQNGFTASEACGIMDGWDSMSLEIQGIPNSRRLHIEMWRGVGDNQEEYQRGLETGRRAFQEAYDAGNAR